jgi:hypothetical protein
MPYLRMNSTQGVIFSDRQGNWNYPGVNGPLNVTFEYRGLFNQVFNDAGAEYSLVFNAATGNGNVPLMNPASAAAVTAAANAYRHVNTVRDFIRDTDAGDATADFLATSNVNLASTCNAFFNGGSINFYTAGGGCVNTAYSSVVAHEYGHWLNVLYGTGNGPDGMGEGNADVFSLYTFDDPVLGRNFCGVGCAVRNGTNTRQYCGDGNGGCYGGVHNDGEVWMGAAWKVRRNLNTSLGNAAGDAASNALFIGWMNAYNQTQIDSIIEIQWLTLDDNDGNINNGTPNYQDINSGFLEQGFPGFDLPFVVFSNVTELADTTNEASPYVVNADIVTQINPPVMNPTLHYRVNGVGGFQTRTMAPTGGDGFTALIPPQAAPAEVEYYLRAEDAAANSQTFPADAPSDTLFFRVGTITPFLFTDFEAGNNEGWTVGDTGDNATTGVWVRLDPNGTAAQSEDDHTVNPGVLCWFTGQGAVGGGLGDNDVDNGKTTLKTPIFDLAGQSSVRISYWRWYSNNTGSAPNTDPFVVDISNNGGANWVNVESITTGPETNGGWFKHSFSVPSLIATTSNMQVRFVAQDLGSGSIVEAMIDDVRGEILTGGGCAAPVTYGMAKVNGQGIGPAIGYTGTPSFASNDLAATVTTLVLNKAAILFSGNDQADIPFFGGRLLVTGGITRGSLFFLDGVDGSGSVDIPITSGMVGTDRYFQFWYRDPMAPDGNGVGLSNGLCVIFCD